MLYTIGNNGELFEDFPICNDILKLIIMSLSFVLSHLVDSVEWCGD